MHPTIESLPESARLYGLNEIAQFLRVSPKTVYYWVSRHEIPYLKVGRHVRFQVPEVVEFFLTKNRGRQPLANKAKPL